MESFEIPNTDGLSAEEAGQEINKITAEGMEHPYMDGNHPQHSDMVTAVTRLNEIKFADADELEPLERGMQDGLDAKVTKQNDLAVEALKEMDLLTDLGFDRADVPDDIPEFQVSSLRAQRLAATGDYDSLVEQIGTDAVELRRFDIPVSEAVVGALKTLLTDTGMDAAAKQEIAELAVGQLHASKQALHELKKSKGMIL